MAKKMTWKDGKMVLEENGNGSTEDGRFRTGLYLEAGLANRLLAVASADGVKVGNSEGQISERLTVKAYIVALLKDYCDQREAQAAAVKAAADAAVKEAEKVVEQPVQRPAKSPVAAAR